MQQTRLALTDELRAFLEEVMPVAVGTRRSDGSVQMNPAWYELRDDEIWLNPASSRAWGRRLEPGAELTLLFVDPGNQWRWAQMQGVVISRTQDGGEEHIDRLSRRYLGRNYTDHRPDDPRLIVRVAPIRVNGSFGELAAA